MFKRVVYEEWMDVLPIVAFVLTFAVFAFAFVRALRMHKSEADRMARLPVEGIKDDGASTNGSAPTSDSVQSL